jgi:hypothetical protein
MHSPKSVYNRASDKRRNLPQKRQQNARLSWLGDFHAKGRMRFVGHFKRESTQLGAAQDHLEKILRRLWILAQNRAALLRSKTCEYFDASRRAENMRLWIGLHVKAERGVSADGIFEKGSEIPERDGEKSRSWNARFLLDLPAVRRLEHDDTNF